MVRHLFHSKIIDCISFTLNSGQQKSSATFNITQHMHDMHDKHIMHSLARNVALSVHMNDKNLKNKYCEFFLNVCVQEATIICHQHKFLVYTFFVHTLVIYYRRYPSQILVNSSQCMQPKKQITIFFRELYDLYSIRCSVLLPEIFPRGKKKSNKLKEQPQRQDPPPRIYRNAIYVQKRPTQSQYIKNFMCIIIRQTKQVIISIIHYPIY